MESSAACEYPTNSPTEKPNIYISSEQNQKELEITEMEIRILNFLYENGIQFCSPFEKMFDYYEKKQKNSENSGDFSKKNEEKIKLNSVLYLKRKNSLKNTTKD